MKISKRFIHWIVALLLVVVFSTAATIAQGYIVSKQQDTYILNTVSAQTEYGQDGKPDGQMLESVPSKITQDYVYYEDRVLTRYYYDSKSIDYTVDTLNMIFEWVPDDINKYLIAAPMRIAVEENIDTSDKEDSAKALDEICGRIKSGIYRINALNTLSEHSDEYIYFRTDKSWTSLGAYYVAEEFLSSKGIDIISLENYYDDMNIGYVGTLKYLEGAQSLRDYPDLVYFYTLKGSSNTQNITAYDNNEYKEYSSPVIASSRGGTNVFIGAYYSHTIIEGDQKDAGSIIIIGDKNSKLFAPWLIPYYNKVILINPKFFNGDINKIAQMIQAYQIEDFLIIECQPMIGESIYNQNMYLLFKQQKIREEE